MANKSERFPYLKAPSGLIAMPFLPMRLHGISLRVDGIGLVDSGAHINAMPRSLGEQLGFDWHAEGKIFTVGGIVPTTAARSIKVRCQFGAFKSTVLGFAWAEDESVPLLLGQVDFFHQFKVCFFMREQAFEVSQVT